MQRSPGLDETPPFPIKRTQIGNKHSEHLMTEEQEGQSIAAATGAANTIPRISDSLFLMEHVSSTFSYPETITDCSACCV